MKILLNRSSDPNGWGASAERALKELGHEVVSFLDDAEYEKYRLIKTGWAHRLFWKLLSAPVRRNFLKSIRETNPDLIFTIKGAFFSPWFLRKVKKEFPKTPLFIFNPDNPFERRYYGVSSGWIRKSIPIYDAYFIWGKFLMDDIRKAGGKNVTYLPFGYDPALHYSVEVTPEEKAAYGSKLAFIGSWDREREVWLTPLLNYDLKIWGNGWQKAPAEFQKKWQRKAAVGEELAKVAASADIILDFLRPHMAPAHTMKIFEFAAANGFLLSSCGGEFGDFFLPQKEFTCFTTPEEMKAKIDKFLGDPAAREAIKMAAHLKVHEHSYRKRLEVVIRVYESLK